MLTVLTMPTLLSQILFWKEVEDFRSANMPDEGTSRRGSKHRVSYEYSGCKRIYELFIAENSVYEVNISWKERRTLRQAHNENGEYDPEAMLAMHFDRAQTEIFRLMERDSLPRFKKSARWKAYYSRRHDSVMMMPLVPTSSGMFDTRTKTRMASVYEADDEGRASDLSCGGT
jgi:hypothetical protein